MRGLTFREALEFAVVKTADAIGWVDEKDLPKLEPYYELIKKKRDGVIKNVDNPKVG